MEILLLNSAKANKLSYIEKYIMKKLLLLSLSFFFIFSCSEYSDDENIINNTNTTVNCDNLTFTEQDAQGVFSGENYTYTQAHYTPLGEGEDMRYIVSILINEPTGGTCFFPDYEGNANKRIIFSIPTLEQQTYDFLNTNIALNFNTTIPNDINAELAMCWKFELISLDTETNKVYGKIVAKGVDGSTIDGNLTLDLCENN